MERTLILEIGSEEVPARFIEGYAKELGNKLNDTIIENNLSSSSNYELYYTPRRVIYIKANVKERQDDEVKEVIGPPSRICFDKDGRPEKALVSFLQKYGIGESDVYRKESPKGEVVAAKIRIKGENAIDILSKAVPGIISSLKFKKSMKWGNNDLFFVRPIRWILAILGSEIIPFEIAGVKSSNRSYGNFNVDRDGFEVKGRDDFLKTLESKYVIFGSDKRRELIISYLKDIFRESRSDDIVDDSLLEEVVNLLEYPVPIKGGFEERYLELPVELLEVVQRHHQRYFPLRKDGRVLPVFVAFANNPIGDKEIIRKGMEKVLRARLNDAVFFYREDLKKNIEDMACSLKMVMYQKGLGNYDRKSYRLARLAVFIANILSLPPEDVEKIKKAASLAKADLVSLSVGEFPELQGIMGKYFARASGIQEDIAVAIEEHYKPIQSDSELPEGIIGSVVSIADKVDHLCGLFLINQKPTASSDPFGVRRAAQSVVDIIYASRMNTIRTSDLIDFALRGFDIDEIKKNDSKIRINSDAKKEVLEFIKVRIKAQLSESIKPDVAEAILNAESGIEDISSIFERRDALLKFVEDEEFDKFAVVYKRASNITRDFNELGVNETIFEYVEEKDLYKAFKGIEEEYNRLIGKRDFMSAMNLLKVNLYKPIFAFFDKVFVMVEDVRIRNNRLSLLKNIVNMFRKIIDLSYISSMKM